MPEEINRVVADHLSDLLLCPSRTAVDNLASEGITRGVHIVGDVMLDVLNWARQRIEEQSSAILKRFDVEERRYLLATVHRSENTDDPERLSGILTALNTQQETVVFPVHPRTRKVTESSGGYGLGPHVRLIEP